MVPAQEDLTPRQIHDKLQILLALSKVTTPAVVSDQDKGILRAHKFSARSLESLLVVFPAPVFDLSFCFQLGLEMQMQISNRIKAHVSLVSLPTYF
jgi:hypothetical protein